MKEKKSVYQCWVFRSAKSIHTATNKCKQHKQCNNSCNSISITSDFEKTSPDVKES